MYRKIVPVLLFALILVLGGCKKDSDVESFIKDFDGLTSDLVRKVEASPNAAGIADAQKLLDSKKADMKTRLDAMKQLRGYQVSEATLKKLTDSITANGQKMAGLSSIVTAQAIKDPSLVPKFSAFLKSYTDMLQ